MKEEEKQLLGLFVMGILIFLYLQGGDLMEGYSAAQRRMMQRRRRWQASRRRFSRGRGSWARRRRMMLARTAQKRRNQQIAAAAVAAAAAAQVLTRENAARQAAEQEAAEEAERVRGEEDEAHRARLVEQAIPCVMGLGRTEDPMSHDVKDRCVAAGCPVRRRMKDPIQYFSESDGRFEARRRKIERTYDSKLPVCPGSGRADTPWAEQVLGHYSVAEWQGSPDGPLLPTPDYDPGRTNHEIDPILIENNCQCQRSGKIPANQEAATAQLRLMTRGGQVEDVYSHGRVERHANGRQWRCVDDATGSFTSERANAGALPAGSGLPTWDDWDGEGRLDHNYGLTKEQAQEENQIMNRHTGGRLRYPPSNGGGRIRARDSRNSLGGEGRNGYKGDGSTIALHLVPPPPGVTSPASRAIAEQVRVSQHFGNSQCGIYHRGPCRQDEDAAWER
jgi:hypothetical protein